MKRITFPTLAVLWALLALPNTVLAQCPSVVFTPQQTRTDSTGWIRSLAAVDFDGDGVLDLVGTVDSTPNFGVLTTWKGNGDGTFQAPVSLGTSNIRYIILADLNNDGHQDVVMTTYASQLIVRMGNGSGFDAPITTTLNYAPFRLIATHFDGDSVNDIIVSSADDSILVLYHGIGNGTFTETRRIATGPFANVIAAADFDGDGRTDIAYALFSSNAVNIVFQNTDGSFSAPVVLPAGPPMNPNVYPSSLVAADVDGDGKMDLVVSNYEGTNPVASVAIYKNLGSRTFSSTFLVPQTFHTFGNYNELNVLDINNDGHLDLIASNLNVDPSSGESNAVLIWTGNGDGTFRSPSYFATSNLGYFTIAPGAFHGGNFIDIALGAVDGALISAKRSCATQVNLFTTAPVINPDQSAPLHALVSGITASTPLPRGTVTFREGGTTLGTAPVDATGSAAMDLSGLALGTHSIAADFGGNSEEGTATSQSISEKVITFTTTTTLNLPASSIYGIPYTFTVTIHDNPSGQDFCGFYILHVDGVQSEQDNCLPSTSITLNFPVGPHTISASFEGDTRAAPSTSGPHSVTTVKATPAIANTGGALTVRLGSAHTLQFTLTGPAGVAGPTGTLQLNRGSTVLASGTLVNGVVNVSPTLPRGSSDVTALYLGDGNFNGASMILTLSVLPNTSLAIDARGLTNAVSIRCVLPSQTTATALYRSPSGMNSWTLLSGWTPLSEFDNSVPLRGVLYDYRLDATVSGKVQSSNIATAILFNDDPVVANTTLIKRQHFDELRLAVNVMRAAGGLAPFNYDPNYAGQLVRASFLAELRTALTEARQSLGMLPPVFTDTATPGVLVKAIHIQELRDQAR